MAAAIGWLVETISATLKIDKLDAWIRQVGLADDIQKLKWEIWKVQTVVTTAKSRGVPNELLDEAFALVEERLHEADDVVDELDYYRLQQQVQGLPAPADPSEPVPLPLPGALATRGEPEGVLVAEPVDEGDADAPQRSAGKLRSVVWEHFRITEHVNGKPIKAVCRYCGNEFKCDTKTNGTSSMKKHLENEHSVTCATKPPGAHLPNPSSTGEPIVGSSSGGKGKKRRSKAWDNYEVIENENTQPIKAKCKYCDKEIKCGGKTGTSGMHNHTKICEKKRGQDDQQPPNLPSTSDAIANVTHIVVGDSSSRKKSRVDEESAHITAANTHTTPCDKTTISDRIQEIVSQLQVIRGQVSEVVKLHGPDIPSSSNHHQSTTLDQHLRTSSLVPWNVCGRVAEKNSIIKMITEEKSDGVVVLPIVGIAGVGKTTLAQLVYSDPDVQRQFDQRIWVLVSRNFYEMRLTRDMLSIVSCERHEGVDCFVKLQEILRSRVKSKRVLLILDDVWDDKNDYRWNQLLAPFRHDNAVGNVILVTTRKLSVAKMIGTTEPVKLGALESEDFYFLFKSCALGDGRNDCPGNLCTIGKQIVKKLQGNPLVAITTGLLLRDHLTVDHWSDILRKESWKSLGLSGGIMPALKLSYDELPYRLQQCFSYCSIFPSKYRFLGKDLVYIWISQGFVNCTQNKRLEDTGWEYLNQLVNLGFFEQTEEQQELHEEEEFSLRRQIWYSMCDLMHDFARMVSRTECATIDGLQCNKILPTVQHLSIVTGSAYNKDLHGNIPHNEKFEENLRNSVTSVTKLRTLVVLGKFDSSFVLLFQDIFQKAQNLRLLRVSSLSTGFNSFLCSLANPLHLCYLKLELDGIVPQVLSTFFHLQVLDVGSSMDTSLPNGLLHNLVSLRHLVAHKRVHSSITSIGNLTSIQELHDFEVRISSGFEITQLKYMNELVQLGVSQLDSVKTREEAYGAGLRNKEHLEELHLSWKDAYSEDEHASDTRFESSANMAREVIEGLEPHMDLKHLQISRYNGTTSPAWLANNISVTSLQTLHLDDCGGWRILPSLGHLPFLTKLKLSSMREVKEVLIPSLEELVLIKMPKLVRCSSTSVEGLCSSLRVLQIEDCEALKEFDLFDNDDNSGITQGSCLPGLRNLILDYCPHLEVLKPLPPSTTFCKVLIREVPRFPYMEVSSGEKLEIGNINEDRSDDFDESSDELRILDDKTLAFHNLRNLKLMEIYGCRNLRSFSFEDFSHLVSLTSLEIGACEQLFSSDVTPECTLEDLTAVNCNAFPSLKSLSIWSCGIAGKWLSLMLEHASGLEELSLTTCAHITTVLLPSEEEENSLLTTVLSSGNQDEALTWLARDGLLHVPSSLVSSLKKMTIVECPCLKFNSGKDCFSGFTSLEKLRIWASLVDDDGSDDPENGSSFVFEEEDQPLGANGRWLLPTSLQELDIGFLCYQETLQPCFPRDITSLKKLNVCFSPDLQSIQLQSCTALEELEIRGCGSLAVIVLEGLQPVGSLGRLNVSDCPGLPPCLESFSTLYPRLERLCIDGPSVLTTSFCKHLTSLQSLQLHRLVEMRSLTDEQERALVLLKSLQKLEIHYCSDLIDRFFVEKDHLLNGIDKKDPF
ncbi:putative disease resistance protein RGA1 [Triticum dicoccoides]|uniref:putative disease resistance protein RGA1 n=1 Tax=Triticum dicoccoides TaxID=85692 RepID=UPI00189055C8|nr:putative disease resistance protein RGA1 [Triticum dicoccoides]